MISDKPIMVIDCETSGLDPDKARIVELCVADLDTIIAGETISNWLINPGVPIPAEATAIHGIRDEDVADCPRFADITGTILKCLGFAHIAGFNVTYDVQVLMAEFQRTGIEWEPGGQLIDVRGLFIKKHPRDLQAAVSEYLGGGAWQRIETAPKDDRRLLVAWPYWCGNEPCVAWYCGDVGGWDSDQCLTPIHEAVFPERQPTHWMPLPKLPGQADWLKAHSAANDVIATGRVLMAMLERHDDLCSMSVEQLARYSELTDLPRVDLAGKLVRDADGDAVYTFGPAKGKKVKNDTGFANWMLGKDFTANTKRHVRAELRRLGFHGHD